MLIKNEKGGFYKASHGWLKSRFHFSFAEYYDSANESFGVLRVLNDDEIAPHTGFDTHPHRDMEIITYLIKGELTHVDSMGNKGVLTPGNIQYMSAGTGVTHSEKNEGDEVVELFQMWIYPREKNLKPNYGQREFDPELKKNKLLKMASPDGSDDSVIIQQDAYLYSSVLDGGGEVLHSLKDESGNSRMAYIVVVEGGLVVNEVELHPRDSLRVFMEESILITSVGESHFILIDLPEGDV